MMLHPHSLRYEVRVLAATKMGFPNFHDNPKWVWVAATTPKKKQQQPLPPFMQVRKAVIIP